MNNQMPKIPKQAAYGVKSKFGFDPLDGHKQLIGLSVGKPNAVFGDVVELFTKDQMLEYVQAAQASQAQQPDYKLNELAQIIMSDCGISTTNNDHLYDRILGRLIASSELQSQAQQTESEPQKFVRYRHSKSDNVWFYQHTKFELPEWAIDVEPYIPPAPEGDKP